MELVEERQDSQNIGTICITEQIIKDELVSGLTLYFRYNPDVGSMLHIEGKSLLLGNRDFYFDLNGELLGTGTKLGSCAPTA
ncbi:MAG: hypothetical protein AMJ70_06410 [Dehalococcoidia bacterium SG8_51_3]|nr:MAG: hypothetical protein AMJ70_06410 [Dehalococcoidia bacterium SG8_51_3]